MAQLEAAAGEMRMDVKDVHVDIGMNDKVAKTMLEFIRGAGKGGDGSNTPLLGRGKEEIYGRGGGYP